MSNTLAFSTLGCPEWNLDQILTAAGEYGYTGIELRGYLDEMELPKAQPFTLPHRGATKQRFADAGIAVCCVSSSGTVAKENFDHLESHVELARDLDCPVVRIFGGSLPDNLPTADALQHAAETLRRFGDIAQENGVVLVLETHDSFSTGAQVADLMDIAQHPAVFSLWDFHHPYRQGEAMDETWRYLSPSLRYVHVKDGKDGTYTLLGEGDVPVFPMLKRVLDGGYTGPISVEWEKRWKPNIPAPEIALPQYAEKLRTFLSEYRA
ncbi:MAG: sugar phosphate isomerase/epimerase [Armatimonadaceae bacterium]